MANGYRTVVAGSFADQLRAAAQSARTMGITRQFFHAARQLNQQLENDPYQVGEPRYHLRRLGVEIRVAVLAPLVIRFGIAQNRPIVWLLGIWLVPAPSVP